MRLGTLGVLCAVGCRFGFDAVVGDASDGATQDSIISAACAERPAITTPTWWVATTGSDSADGSQSTPVATITRAVSLAAATGGTIVVMPGSYSAEPGGEVSISTSQPLRLLSHERYRAVVPRFSCDGCQDLLIAGFEVTGSTLSSIQINAGLRVTVTDNIAHNTNSAGIRVTSGSMMIEIVGNVVYDTRTTEIHINDAAGLLIHGNVLFNAAMTPNGFSKIWLEAATSARVSGNVVFRALGDYATYGLISLRQTATTVVENNVVGASPDATNTYASVGFDQGNGTAMIRHNTFVGPMPGSAFGVGVPSVAIASGFSFVNNLWNSAGTTQPFTVGSAPSGTVTLRHNLYWNAPSGNFAAGGAPTPSSDGEAIVADPGVAFAVPAAPTWSPISQELAGGAKTVCDARNTLAIALAALPATSAATAAADPAESPAIDIVSRPRPSPATLGAFEP